MGTPDAGAFWRVCAQHQVKVLFTAPTAMRAIKQQDPDGKLLAAHDLSKLEALYLAGERCDPPTAVWAADLLKIPVVDHWWQTETGWAITSGFRQYGLFPFRPGSGGRPCPGYDLHALDDDGHLLGAGATGNLSIRLPLPPGCGPTLWQNDEGYRTSYLADFPGWYRTGDAGVVDEAGDVWVMGRTDDIINVAGHRLSTGSMEEVLASHQDVAECAVIGAKDELKGQTPMGLVVLKSGVNRPHLEIERELVALIRERIGPVASFRDARVVARLPKTRSGQILRASIRKIADGEASPVPPTIEDPGALEELAALFAGKDEDRRSDFGDARLSASPFHHILSVVFRNGRSSGPSDPAQGARPKRVPAQARPGYEGLFLWERQRLFVLGWLNRLVATAATALSSCLRSLGCRATGSPSAWSTPGRASKAPRPHSKPPVKPGGTH